MFVKKLRIFGNLGFIAGQFCLLFVSKEVGLCIIIACSLMGLPYFLKHRDYDVVGLIAVGLVINIAGLFLPGK